MRMLPLAVMTPGRMPYDEALKLQEHLRGLLGQGLPDTLILLEHPHVITIGRRGTRKNILVSEDILESQEISVFEITRGGDVTYHGPGQLVGYCVFDLKRHEGDIRQLVGNIQEVVIRFLAERGITAERRNREHTGVWVGNEKIAAIGISVNEMKTMHGFSLNIDVNLDYFQYINPCGVPGAGVISLHTLTKKHEDFNKATVRIADLFCEVFSMSRIDIRKTDIQTILNSKGAFTHV
ncbi:MAG: lipoyl(octanoyl) transferase [Spirochaetaceae bacterium]|nr:MAG: lipoyl(octanoyl) transferase [Spirochaetaceae bacterium]